MNLTNKNLPVSCYLVCVRTLFPADQLQGAFPKLRAGFRVVFISERLVYVIQLTGIKFENYPYRLFEL